MAMTTVDALRGLRMQVDRLDAKNERITGWTGDEELLREIVAAIRGQIDWLESEGVAQVCAVSLP